jgi:LPXTG-motif cell wall-anchored protein
MLGRYTIMDTAGSPYGIGEASTASTVGSVVSNIFGAWMGFESGRLQTKAAERELALTRDIETMRYQTEAARLQSGKMKTSTIVSIALGVGGVLLLGGALVLKKKKKGKK